MLHSLIGLTILAAGAPAMPRTSASQAGTASSSIARAAANKAFIRAAFDRWMVGGGTFFDEVLAPDMGWTMLRGRAVEVTAFLDMNAYRAVLTDD